MNVEEKAAEEAAQPETQSVSATTEQPTDERADATDLLEMIEAQGQVAANQGERLRVLEEIIVKISEDGAQGPAEQRVYALFELKLKAAGLRLGKEIGEATTKARSDSAEAKTQSAEAGKVAAEAKATAEGAKTAIDQVLAVANEALEGVGTVAEAAAEMRQIGEFVDGVKNQVDEAQKKIEQMFDYYKGEINQMLDRAEAILARIEAAAAQPVVQPQPTTPAVVVATSVPPDATPPARKKPWEK